MNQQEPAIAAPKSLRHSHDKVLPNIPLPHNPIDLGTIGSFTLRRHASSDNVLQLTRHKPSTRHQRGFSFRPGDDAKSSELPDVGQKHSRRASVIGSDTDPVVVRTLPGSTSLAHDTTGLVRALHARPIQHNIPTISNASGPQTSSPPSCLTGPQRDDSGRSIITVIRHNPSRRSSASDGAALSGSCDFRWQEQGKSPRHNVAAVAAARAASERLTKASGLESLA